MREILFRGKRNDNGEWVYGSLLRLNLKKTFICDGTVWIGTLTPCKFEVIPETVGQYTGLTDKNGKKVFEGDIFRYGQRFDYACYLESIEHPEEYDGKIYDTDIEIDVVEWGIDMDYPAFDFKNHQFECNGLAQIMCGDYEYEVIGNIHDNKLEDFNGR